MQVSLSVGSLTDSINILLRISLFPWFFIMLICIYEMLLFYPPDCSKIAPDSHRCEICLRTTAVPKTDFLPKQRYKLFQLLSENQKICSHPLKKFEILPTYESRQSRKNCRNSTTILSNTLPKTLKIMYY